MGNVCDSQSNTITPKTEEKPRETTPPAVQIDEQPRPVTRGVSPRPPSARPITARPDDDDEHNSIIRLLLLGAAESGKSTLLAQIRVLYNQSYSEQELFHRKVFVYSNILQSIQMLIQFVQAEGSSFTSNENTSYAYNLLLEDSHYTRFTTEQVKALTSIWNDPVIQEAYMRRSSFNLNDSTKYFMDNLERINTIDYTPTPHDLIMSYIPTLGVQNVIFTASNKTFQLFDMDGQKMARRKWATMYDGIDAIFFCLAISEYDQVMVEDMKTNRLTDSMDLLDMVAHEPKFAETPIFVFLNEIDVFTNKLEIFPLEQFLPDYNGKSTEEAITFIENMAKVRVGRNEKRLFHVYRTVLIDTKSTEKILKECFKKHLK